MDLKVGTRVALAMRRGVVTEVDHSGIGSFMLRLDGPGATVTVRVEADETWLEERFEVPKPKTLREYIAHGINRTSSENGSNTPDFILAEYLTDCLAAFDRAVKWRAEWYGTNVDASGRLRDEGAI